MADLLRRSALEVHRELRIGRRILIKIAPDTCHDRRRKLFLVCTVLELLLFVRIRYEIGFDENRRDIRRLEHQQTRLLHFPSVYRAYLAELSDDF